MFFKFNDDEAIFESTQFKKYVNKRKNELAEYLKISVSELCSYIHCEMKLHDNDGKSPDDIGGDNTNSRAAHSFFGLTNHFFFKLTKKWTDN